MSMDTLRKQLNEAESLASLLRDRIANATCAEAGHDMKFFGGANAGCCDDCSCGVPVHECTQCGMCDFGDNDEANKICAECPQFQEEQVRRKNSIDVGKP